VDKNAGSCLTNQPLHHLSFVRTNNVVLFSIMEQTSVIISVRTFFFFIYLLFLSAVPLVVVFYIQAFCPLQIHYQVPFKAKESKPTRNPLQYSRLRYILIKKSTGTVHTIPTKIVSKGVNCALSMVVCK
jgi:hypothetical protein